MRSAGLSKPLPRQLSIFELNVANDEDIDATPPRKTRAVASRDAGKATARKGDRVRQSPVRLIGMADLPAYSPELIEQIDGTIADLPSGKLWFTYKDVQHCFGISRATAIRRMKEGLVPGIRLAHGRVLDDGPVRRLDRAQLRWLLLAVRRGRA